LRILIETNFVGYLEKEDLYYDIKKELIHHFISRTKMIKNEEKKGSI